MSGSSLLVTGSMVGQTITFASKNPVDPTVYVGIVTGIIAYALVGGYGADTLSYTTAVQKIDSTVGPPNVLNYFLVTLQTNQSTTTTIAFANEWIQASSFDVIQTTAVYTINVYDIPNRGLSSILAVLSAVGFNAAQVTTLSQVVL